MSLKKTPAEKRTALPLRSDFTKAFLKDWIRISTAGRHDMRRAKEVMLLPIANDAPLGPEWFDHPLTGPWTGSRECHIGGDFLLIYQADAAATIFVRLGTHADLF